MGDAEQLEQHRRVLVALVRDEPGVLTRIATVFRRRGFNLASVTVGKSERAGLSRMTFVVEGPASSLVLANLHLSRLVAIVEVNDVTVKPTITSELAIIKVNLSPDKIGEVNSIASIFGAKTVDLSAKTITFEVSGMPEKLDAMVSMLEAHGVLEINRTGQLSTLKNSVFEAEEK